MIETVTLNSQDVALDVLYWKECSLRDVQVDDVSETREYALSRKV